MESTHCVNCGRELSPDFNTCPGCGQKTSIHRFTLPHFLHEFFHAFTHADRGAFVLLRELAVRPGVVLQEYIVEGKRKKYFNPFTLLIIILGFSVFMNSVFHPYQKNNAMIDKQIQTAETAEKKAIFQHISKKMNEVNEFLEKKTNIVIFFTVPVMALAFWLVFKGKGFNYAEHLVAYFILTSMLSLFSSLTLVPLMSVLSDELFFWGAIINLIAQLAYTSYAYTKFLKLKSFGEILMVSVANIMGIALWMVVLMIAMFIYIVLS